MTFHDDIMTWKHSVFTNPLWGSHPVDSPPNGAEMQSFYVFLLLAKTNCLTFSWVDNATNLLKGYTAQHILQQFGSIMCIHYDFI